MEFSEVVRGRRMVRRYDGRPVDPAALDRILEAASRAPSAGFAQGQSFVSVTDPELRRGVAGCCGEDQQVAAGRPPWVSSAPVLVVPCVRPATYAERYAEPDKGAAGRAESWAVPFWWVDGGASLMLLLLAAVDEGLSAGFLDIADRVCLRGLLGVPDDVEPLGVVTIGYRHPDERPVGSAVRRERRNQVHSEHWGGTSRT